MVQTFRTIIDCLSWLGQISAFGYHALLSSVKAIFVPSCWIRPFYGVVVGALPLAVVTGLAMGLVIWMHTRDVLARTSTGAVGYLPSFLAVAVLLELAPVGAGLILATRTGASLGAELASMRVGEQIDALESMGVSPLRRLVGPRVFACFLAAPVLHLIIAAVALSSGLLAESISGSTTYLRYSTAAIQQLFLEDVIPATLKTFVFGYLVSVAGCFIGLNCHDGSEGVGRAATDSVVICSLFVLTADVFLVGLIKMIQSI